MGDLSGIPIKIDDRIVGVIKVDEKMFRETWGDECLEILKASGDLLAIAIKNAHLEHGIRMLDGVRTDFISSFPHELRTPITIMKDTFSMLLDGTLGEINDKQRKALQLAASNVERLWRLSEELLELSAIALAKTQMKRKLLDVVELIADRIAKFHPIAEHLGILLVNGLPEEKIEIWGDKDKLSQAIDCLIDNAIKYNQRPGKVHICLEDGADSVKIDISDTGAGIAEEDFGMIFDKFYRVTMRAKNSIKKWGIGLPVVREIIEMHRGTVSVKSEIGKGSTFTLTLPRSLR